MSIIEVSISKEEWEALPPTKQQHVKKLVRDRCGRELEIRYDEGDNNGTEEES